ncbi:MAG: hypothetical protein QXR76_05650 [Candidatus Bathyarchaeia archaeon]
MQKRIIVISLFLVVTCAFLSVPQAHAYWDTTIDVLVVESERFTAFADSVYGYYRWLWYSDLDNAFKDFWNTFKIKFVLRCVIKNWHIDSISDNAYYVLEEAISDFKYKSGETTYNGYFIDLLIVFVDWDEIDMIGLSPPDWKALIISNFPFNNVPMVNVFVHELSHQFYATHCDNYNCVMWEMV